MTNAPKLSRQDWSLVRLLLASCSHSTAPRIAKRIDDALADGYGVPMDVREGLRVRVYVPKGTALGALHDEEGASRRRVVTVIDPCLMLVDFTWAGQHQIPREWIREA